MGVSSEGGSTVCTDDDTIEVSNLSRQFLFRRNDVKQSKSQCAANAVRKMNEEFNVVDMQDRVNFENEEIFNDDFWNQQNCVINAVDNIKARLHIDNRCVWYGKHLLESGTLGTKCNQ